MMHKLIGAKACDRVSGFTGLVTARTEYMYQSSDVFQITPSMKEGGSYVEPKWFDESRVNDLTSETPVQKEALEEPMAPPKPPRYKKEQHREESPEE